VCRNARLGDTIEPSFTRSNHAFNIVTAKAMFFAMSVQRNNKSYVTESPQERRLIEHLGYVVV